MSQNTTKVDLPAGGFLRNLEKSNLLSQEQLDAARRIGASEPLALATALVQEGFLTRWQAGQLLAGTTRFYLGKYKLLERIGSGGMGTVFKVEHPALGRLGALKLMNPAVLERPGAVARFRREIEAASVLNHPNIVRALDADQVGQQYFLVMDYVEGRDLGQLLEQHGRLDVDVACECIRQAALGLQHAHEHGLVHRDIKPANLLVSRGEDGAYQVKILDMGLARFVCESGDASLTKSGQIMGTASYISPEQAEDTRSVDIRTDIFSLGCTLFEILAGQQPFGGTTVMEKLMARAFDDAPPIRKVRPDLPEALEAVVAKMLVRDPDRRYQIPAEVALALAPFTVPVAPAVPQAAPAAPAATVSDRLELASSRGPAQMICVSLAQTSRTLVIVDMINAGQQCDLIEVRLDRFEKQPDLKALLAVRPKPLLFSCRRVDDGGNWSGSEQARLTLLRQAILDGVDYVEIESDVASQIKRYGNTKRIISYTNTQGVPRDLDAIYERCCQQDPDVVKLTIPTKKPEAAWPLIKILAKSKQPTVAVGWGRASITLNVLGRRYKAPWTYAALEKGMEAYPGMATIGDLESIYDYRNIDSRTPLLGVCGTGRERAISAKLLNHGLRLAGNKARCLPLEIGKIEALRKIVDAVRLVGVLVDGAHREAILPVLTEREEAVETCCAADFVVPSGEKWRGFNTLYRAAIGAMEDSLSQRYGTPQTLEGRTVLVVGCTALGRSIAAGVRKRKGLVVLADPDPQRAHQWASQLGARYVAPAQVYSTICDGMVLCPRETDPEPGKAAIDIPKSCAREGMFALDLTDFPSMTLFLDEVRVLGGTVVRPSDVLVRMVQTVLKAITGRPFTSQELRGALAEESLDEIEAPAM